MRPTEFTRPLSHRPDGDSSAQAHPPTLRHDRFNPLCGFRHHPAGLSPPATTNATSPMSLPIPNPGNRRWPKLLEDMDEVVCYVKNHNLGFTIPYTLNGEEKNYIPDFIACIDDGHGTSDLLNLIIEVTGEKKKGQGGQGRHRPNALGAGSQQPRRFRTLGISWKSPTRGMRKT